MKNAMLFPYPGWYEEQITKREGPLPWEVTASLANHAEIADRMDLQMSWDDFNKWLEDNEETEEAAAERDKTYAKFGIMTYDKRVRNGANWLAQHYGDSPFFCTMLKKKYEQEGPSIVRKIFSDLFIVE